VQAAAVADVASSWWAGTTETEGMDAASMDLPPDQVALIRDVVAVNPRDRRRQSPHP
jgi:hypothetical protein